MVAELPVWNVQESGDRVELKRVVMNIPAGHDLSGLIFVIRSKDSTAWWRDGAATFYLDDVLHA